MDLSRCRPDPERRAAATWTADGRLVFFLDFFLAMVASLVWRPPGGGWLLLLVKLFYVFFYKQVTLHIGVILTCYM